MVEKMIEIIGNIPKAQFMVRIFVERLTIFNFFCEINTFFFEIIQIAKRDEEEILLKPSKPQNIVS